MQDPKIAILTPSHNFVEL